MSNVAPISSRDTDAPEPGELVELAFLAEVFFDNSTVARLAEVPTPEQFADPICGRIWAIAQGLLATGAQVSVPTVARKCRDDEFLSTAGAVAIVANLGAQAQAIALDGLAADIIERAKRRDLKAALLAAVQACDSGEVPLPEIVARLDTAKGDAFNTGEDYPLLSLSDLSSLPAPDWLIRGRIGTASFGVIYGPPKSMKTYLAIDAGLHIAHEMDWHGLKVRQAGVLYIVGEGASGIQQRVDGWHMHYGIRHRNAPFMVLPVAVHLLKPNNVRRLKRTIDRAQRLCGFEIGLVIIDTVSRAIPGADENATEVMTALVQACDEIREHSGATVLGVHHAGKDKAKGLRGSSSLLGAVDFSFRVDRLDDTVTFTNEAQKDAEEADPMHFVMATVEWYAGNSEEPGEARKTLVPILSHDQGAPAVPSARASLKGHKATALKVLQALIEREGLDLPDSVRPEGLDRSKIERGIRSGQAADKLSAEFFAVVEASEDKRADTAERTARRAIKDLKALGMLGTSGDWLWLI